MRMADSQSPISARVKPDLFHGSTRGATPGRPGRMNRAVRRVCSTTPSSLRRSPSVPGRRPSRSCCPGVRESASAWTQMAWARLSEGPAGRADHPAGIGDCVLEARRETSEGEDVLGARGERPRSWIVRIPGRTDPGPLRLAEVLQRTCGGADPINSRRGGFVEASRWPRASISVCRIAARGAAPSRARLRRPVAGPSEPEPGDAGGGKQRDGATRPVPPRPLECR